VEKTEEDPVLKQIRRRKSTWLGHTLQRCDDSTAKQALQCLLGSAVIAPLATWPRRKRPTKDLEKRSGEGFVDSKIQVQLEKDGGGSIELG